MTSWKPQTIEELIAALPWEAGYQLRDGDVAILGITEDGTPGLCAPIITNQLNMEHTADALTHGEQMLARTGHPHMVTVAYGGVSAEQALTAHATQLGRDIELAESLRVEYGELYGSKSPTREPFVNVGQVPDVSEQMRLRGFSHPFGDRNLMLEGLTPNDQQQVQSLEPNAAAAIEELMPGPKFSRL